MKASALIQTSSWALFAIGHAFAPAVRASSSPVTLDPAMVFEIRMSPGQHIADITATNLGLAFLVTSQGRSPASAVVVTDFFGSEQSRFPLPPRRQPPVRLRFHEQTGFAVFYRGAPPIVLLLSPGGDTTSEIVLPRPAHDIELVGGSLIGLNGEMAFPFSGPLARSASPVYYGRGIYHLYAAPLSATSVAIADLGDASITSIDIESGQRSTVLVQAPEIPRPPRDTSSHPYLRPPFAASPSGLLFCLPNRQPPDGLIAVAAAANGSIHQILLLHLPRFNDQRTRFNPAGRMMPPYHLVITDVHLYVANKTRGAIYPVAEALATSRATTPQP